MMCRSAPPATEAWSCGKLRFPQRKPCWTWRWSLRGHLPGGVSCAGYIPGRNAHMRLDLRIDPEQPPAELILAEGIPPGLTFVDVWELDAGPLANVPMRHDGGAVSWFFWNEGVAPRDLSLILDLQVADGLAEPVGLAGEVAGSGGTSSTLGPALWTEAELQTAGFQLTSGWNAFSCPLVPQTPDIAELLPAAGVHPAVWEWNGNEFVKATAIVPGHGYWILCSDDTSFEIRGWPETRVVAGLGSEWVFAATFGTLSEDHLPDGVDAWEWDAETKAYISRDTLAPATTYWLKAPIRPKELDLR
jgi:hypothetical protein